MTDSKTATELLNELRFCLGKCRRTEKAAGFDTYWVCADVLDAHLDALERAIAATLGRCASSDLKQAEELLVEYYAAVTDGIGGYDYTSGDLAGEYAKKIAATLGNSECDTRWHEMFGTPEKAARWMVEYCSDLRCCECPICHDELGVTCELSGTECAWAEEENDYNMLLEWLCGKAVKR